MMLLSHFPLTFHHIHNEIPSIYCMAYDYSHADLDGLFHERDVPWKDILSLVLLLLLVNSVSGFRLELICIPHQKYQVKPHLSPWLSAACAAGMLHGNHFFVSTRRINVLNLK